MGSFYATCSITRQTIVDEQELVVQFMLPVHNYSRDPEVGQLFVDSFLKVAKTSGLEAAVKSFEESTSTWGNGYELGQKGLVVSNDGSFADYVPFGPAIRGIYTDCGTIKPLDDADTKSKVSILEQLLGGIPFNSILEAAIDDRWYTLGLNKYEAQGTNDWMLEGITSKLPEAFINILKKLNVTYIHAGAYDVLVKEDFSPEYGTVGAKVDYDTKWRMGAVDNAIVALTKCVTNLQKYAVEDDQKKKRDLDFLDYEVMQRIGTFSKLDNIMAISYLACIARVDSDLGWFRESLNFMYNLGGMCIRLLPSDYGSQHTNFGGWNRINEAIRKSIDDSPYNGQEIDEE